MSAKLLMGLSEENPELEKQIGCMTGIFQVFDRHHFITGRRIIGHNSHKRLPSGKSRSNSNAYTEEHNTGSPKIVMEYNRKSSKENRRISMESPASSPSSSFSSLDCTKATKPKSSETDTKHTRNDFRDVVKDSINTETHALSVKTSVKGDAKKDNVLKHRDSPRPIMAVELNDSLRVLVRLKEAHNICEAPRFSCDGREISRSKSNTKLREFPRLSLDSREVSLRSSSLETQSLSPGIPSVVAKLMGLDAMPNSPSQRPMEMVKCDSKKSSGPFSPKSSLGVSDPRLRSSGAGSKHVSKQTESVYSQIERKVQELEFSQFNKDFRALKHILDKMQAKGILEKKEIDDQHFNIISQKNQNMKPVDSQNLQVRTPRASETPIVIMKPARSVKRADDLEGLSGLRKLKTSDSASRRKAKDQAPRASPRDHSSEKKIEESNPPRIRIPQMQRSPRPQQLVRERIGSPAKTTSSISPRAQQRKLELERKPQSPTRKHKASRKPLAPVSPNANVRAKPSRTQTDATARRELADEMSQREDGNISLATQGNEELTQDDCSIILDSPIFQLDNHKIQNEDSSSTDSAINSMEQPSPISVLDQAAFYQDDSPLSPVKKISCSIQDDEITMRLMNAASSKLSTEIYLQKLSGIKILIKKLTNLCSPDDTDDHDLVSQILLSAGILSIESTPVPKSNAERLYQELMLDVAKETLTRKFVSMSKHGSKKLNMCSMTTEVCSEIKQLLAKRPLCASLEDDYLAFREDLVRESDEWGGFGTEISGMALEIERSIFKDLIDEIVMSENYSHLQVKANGRRRQLFT